MKRISIRQWSPKGMRRVDPLRSKWMYFSSQRKLIELERRLKVASQARKSAAKSGGFNIKKLMPFAVMMAFFTALALGGCSSTQSADTSSGKTKMDNAKAPGHSSGGY